MVYRSLWTGKYKTTLTAGSYVPKAKHHSSAEFWCEAQRTSFGMPNSAQLEDHAAVVSPPFIEGITLHYLVILPMPAGQPCLQSGEDSATDRADN